MGALTGCGNGYTVPAGEEPVNASAGQVPGTPSWLGQAPEVAERDITETIDTEVLVVGCRTAGLPAVISAAENGAKVLGIDRTSTCLLYTSRCRRCAAGRKRSRAPGGR